MATDKDRFKILVISDYRSVGSSRPEAEIFIRLAQLGHMVHVISHADAHYYNQRFREHGITVFENPPLKKISFSYIRFLKSLLKENKYDFVHAFNSKGLTNAVWALAGNKAKLIAYRGYAGQTHWYDPMMYLKYFHPRVDHIICVSHDIEVILSRNMTGARNKLSTIPKGHDPAWYKSIIPVDRKTLGFTEDDILVCFLANVRPFKGLPYLLKATHLIDASLPIHFLFIGHGYDEPSLKKEMDASPFKAKFHLLGFRSDAREVLASCDCLVQTSTHGEGLSKSVVESMFLGIAPIITDIPGNRDLLIDGESGWMIPVKDPVSIAKALTEMASDKAERERRGIHAAEHMRTHFHIDQTVERFVSLYERLNL
jgi:glycosyltransferase involved in cell wall biosynthesis